MTTKHQHPPADDAIARLRLALTGAMPDTDAIDLAQLEAYAVAQLRGEDAAVLYPQLAQQLDASEELAAIYSRLSDLLAADAADALPQPERMPQPDLSFLQRAPSPAERIAQALDVVGRRLRVVFSAELLPQLAPPPALSAVRSVEERGAAIFTLSPEQLPEGVDPLTVTAYRSVSDPTLCQLEVIVEPLDREFPDFGGIPVTVTMGEFSETAETDSWGTATFSDVAVVRLADLVLDVDMSPSAT